MILIPMKRTKDVENILLTILILTQVIQSVQLYQLKKNSNTDSSLINELLKSTKARLDRLFQDVEKLEK